MATVEEESKTGIISAQTGGFKPVAEAQPADQPVKVEDPAPTRPALDERPSLGQAEAQPKIEPKLGEVEKETGTVAGQMDTLLGKDSAYIDQARRDAVRTSSGRGLINTSIAAGAGTEAAVRAALPIAQQDATTYSEQNLRNQAAQNEFLKNEQSANLNKEMAAFETSLSIEKDKFSNELKKDYELFINDAKFSDELKLQYVKSINTIMTDSQQQITDIGLSDRKADQQAAAIDLVVKNRENEIAVYQDLLGQFDDWEWGTEFTPERTDVEPDEGPATPTAGGGTATGYPPGVPADATPNAGGGYTDSGGNTYNQDGSWVSD